MSALLEVTLRVIVEGLVFALSRCLCPVPRFSSASRRHSISLNDKDFTALNAIDEGIEGQRNGTPVHFSAV